MGCAGSLFCPFSFDGCWFLLPGALSFDLWPWPLAPLFALCPLDRSLADFRSSWRFLAEIWPSPLPYIYASKISNLLVISETRCFGKELITSSTGWKSSKFLFVPKIILNCARRLTPASLTFAFVSLRMIYFNLSLTCLKICKSYWECWALPSSVKKLLAMMISTRSMTSCLTLGFLWLSEIWLMRRSKNEV